MTRCLIALIAALSFGSGCWLGARFLGSRPAMATGAVPPLGPAKPTGPGGGTSATDGAGSPRVVPMKPDQRRKTALQLVEKVGLCSLSLGEGPFGPAVIEVRKILGQLWETDLPGIAAELDQLAPNGAGVEQARMAVMQRWAMLAPTEALAYVTSLRKGRQEIDTYKTLFGSWASHDAEAARAALSQVPENFRREARSALICQLALQDVEGTLRELGPEETDPLLLESIAKAWVNRDVSAASKFVMNLPEGGYRNVLLSGVADQWARKDPEQVLAWARELPPSNQRGAVRQALTELSKSDPARAAAEVLRWMSDSPSALASFHPSVVVQDWCKQGGEAEATAWLLQLPESSKRHEAAWSAAMHWANNDVAGTSRWIASLPAGGDRDMATVGLVAVITAKDPSSALAWADSVTDPKLRVGSYVAVFNKWRDVEPDAAQKAFDALPAGDRDAIENRRQEEAKRPPID